MRIMAWNVMGQLGNISDDGSCDRFLHDYDVIGLVHTGVYNMDSGPPSVSSAHDCICLCTRSIAPQASGIACFVRKRLKKHTTVMRDRIDHGAVWIRIVCPQNHGKVVYIGFVYLPPQASSYYSHEGGVSYDDHWLVLQQDIMFYQSKGQVIIMGDFNARCGMLNEWDMLDPHIRRGTDIPNSIKQRRSKDPNVNKMGKRLIDLCEKNRLYILNGRAHGDSNGSNTFKHLGHHTRSGGKSVIDYSLVSEDLITTGMGTLVDFQVIPTHECPPRGEGGSYDHCPIASYVGWSAVTVSDVGQPADSAGQPNDTHMKWRAQHRELYTDIVQTDGVVLGYLARVRDIGISVQDSCDALIMAVTRAAEVLHRMVGGVFVTAAEIRKNQGRKQSWLSADATRLRKEMNVAEQDLPNSRDLVTEIRRMYRKQVKIDRRRFMESRRNKMRHDMTSNIKAFWKRFANGRRVTSSSHSVNQWSNYFDTLFNEGQKQGMTQEDFDLHCQKFEDLFGAPSEQDIEKARGVNDVVTNQEVMQALGAVNLGKAVGDDKIPAEFFRQAYHEVRRIGDDGKPRIVREYLLTSQIAILFNKIISRQQYPDGWAMGVITPVPKPKGDLHSMDNYRAITVGSAISKMFAQVVRGRLDNWAEGGGWRAKTQFGFRKDLGTGEAIFLLRHLVEKAHTSGKALCTAFIDFRKAYDSVPRELLWKCLGKMGIHGEMLEIIQQMYRNVRLKVKVDDIYGPEFESVIGVKQGDPLSPLLFGLFIDRFVTFLKKHCPTGDVMCDDEMVQCILYADDMVLLAHDPSMLQRYLDVLGAFCEATGMSVNVKKSEIVIFFRQWATAPLWQGWYYNGKKLTESQEFIYLGVVFHSKGIKHSITKAVKRRITKARSALFVKIGICHGMRVYDPKVLAKLFDGVVVPSALYGSALWGPDVVMLAKQSLIHQPLEELQWLFLRMTLWLGKATPHLSMLQEMGRDLLITSCIQNSIGFWNKVAKRPANCILAKAAKENMIHVRHGWCACVISMVNKAAGMNVSLMDEIGRLTTLPKKQILEQVLSKREVDNNRILDPILMATYDTSGSMVRGCPDHIRSGYKQFKYAKWFADGNADSHEPVIFNVTDVFDIRILSRFRCGMHWLATEKGRVEVAGRSRRVCRCCTKGEREDELHLLFCDAYEQIRNELPIVFESDVYKKLHDSYKDNGSMVDACMNMMMNVKDVSFMNGLVGYLRRSVKVRDRLLSGELI